MVITAEGKRKEVMKGEKGRSWKEIGRADEKMGGKAQEKADKMGVTEKEEGMKVG